MITVSDSNVRSFSLESLDVAQQTADLVIGACIPPDPYSGSPGWDGEGYPHGCSAAPGHVGDAWWLVLIAIPLLARSRRAKPASPR
jgi:hypothetical protein